jgi:hypothetical protein
MGLDKDGSTLFWQVKDSGRCRCRHSCRPLAARVGRIDRLSQGCRCALRCDRPKRRRAAAPRTARGAGRGSRRSSRPSGLRSLGRSAPCPPPGRSRVEEWRGGVAPFPLPAHRTGQAVFRHPALGQDLTLSPTGRSSAGRSSGPGPARRAGTDRGSASSPDSSARASSEASDGAGPARGGRWLDTRR